MARALIVIDIQNDYFEGGVLPLHQAEAVEAGIVAAIGKARSAGDRVILVQHVSPAKQGLFATGSTGAEIRPAIRAAAGEAPVVVKQVADAFQGTDLSDHLSGIDEVLICGMMTQNCVVFTAMSRDADPYAPRVIGELCTAPSEIVHKVALSALTSKGKVCGTADAWS